MDKQYCIEFWIDGEWKITPYRYNTKAEAEQAVTSSFVQFRPDGPSVPPESRIVECKPLGNPRADSPLKPRHS
jgi:hypothetical protein